MGHNQRPGCLAKSDDGKRANDPHLLNYWGFSYGVTLLFP
jgi:hypothetical protein